MIAWLDAFGYWLVDYYLLSGAYLLLLAAVMSFVTQPARRVALGWTALAGLVLLAVLAAIPTWPRLPLAISSGPPPVSMRVADVSPPLPDGKLVSDANTDALEVDALEVDALEVDALEVDARSVFPERHTREESDANHIAGPSASAVATRSRGDASEWIGAGWLRWAAGLMLAGTLAMSGWLLLGAVATAHLRATARQATPSITSALDKLRDDSRAAPRVLLSDRINQGLAVGWLRPAILLPDRFENSEPPESVETVLAHELAHIRHGDLQRLAAMRLLMLILFAHPLYWWLRSRIRIDQELVADAAAGDGRDRAQYAELLLRWFRTNAANRSRWLTATVGIWDRPHLLKRRISMLLNDQLQVETRCPTSWRLGSWLLLVAAILPLSLVTFRQTPLAAADPPADGNAGLVSSGDPSLAQPVIQTDSPAPVAEPIAPETPLPQDQLALAGEKYQSANEAWGVAVAFLNSRNFAASQEPLEAALRMAPDDAFRLKVYDALRPAYRLLPEVDKMIEASEFVLENTDSPARRSLTRTDLLGFAYQRGKIDVLAQRYEDRLKKDPDDRLALYMLSELYERLKRDPRRASEVTERLLALEKEEGKPLDVATAAKLAAQYVQQGRFAGGAELFETIAPLDEKMAAWHWKEAGTAWLKASDKEKALAAAKKADENTPERRSQQLTHFWHRHMGDIYLGAGQAALAIPHFEEAIKNTNIEGYIKDCEKSLAVAREQAGN